MPTCRGPVGAETPVPSPHFVCKHGGSGRQEKSGDERNESNQGRMGNDFESLVSAQKKGANQGPRLVLSAWTNRFHPTVSGFPDNNPHRA